MKTWKDFPIKKDKDNNYYVAFLINSNYVSDYHVVQDDKIGAFNYDEVSKFYEALTGSEMVYNADGDLVQQKQTYLINEPTLEELKAAKLEEIKAAYLKDLYKIVWVQQDTGKLYGYDTDKDSQVDFSMSYQRAKINGTSPYNVYTNPDNTEEKEFLTHTPAMFEATLTEAGNQQVKTYEKYYQLKQLIEQAQDKDSLAVIIW